MVKQLHVTSVLDSTESEIIDVLRESGGFDPGSLDVVHLRSQLREQVLGEGLETTRGLREKLLHDSSSRDRLIRRLTRPQRQIFNDPDFYRSFLISIVPLLRTYPFIRIWHMDCGAGENVYAMAILFREAGLYERCRLYATDSDDRGLRRAREGVFDLVSLARSDAGYRESGGHFSLRDYYTVGQDHVEFDPSLRRNMIFAQHNVMTDGVFNEFHVIVCRDVFSMLDPAVGNRVIELLRGSLVRLGFLSLGEAEQAPSVDSGMRYQQYGPAGTFRRMS